MRRKAHFIDTTPGGVNNSIISWLSSNTSSNIKDIVPVPTGGSGLVRFFIIYDEIEEEE